jgi:hypothetical protein
MYRLRKINEDYIHYGERNARVHLLVRPASVTEAPL